MWFCRCRNRARPQEIGSFTFSCDKEDGVIGHQQVEPARRPGAADRDLRHLRSKAVGSQKDCQEEMGSCMVYVCGAVENPGVYELPENSRVYEAVAMAGGMTEDAGMEAVNQAEFVTDGQMLRIPTMEEVAAAQEESESNVDDGLLDINRASVADFMTLPGIGQSKAEALFQYREAHGRFSSIEEIMNVDGIKEGVFNKIKDSIKV